MSKKYIKILISIPIIIIIGVFCFIQLAETKIYQNQNFNLPQTISVEKNKTSKQSAESKKETKSFSEINISLKVLDKVYTTVLKDGSTVYDAMTKIKNENQNFDFKYKEYPSLGIFVNEINGKKGTSGKYWIYYINNTEASVGVSKYILKEGDSILWKQE